MKKAFQLVFILLLSIMVCLAWSCEMGEKETADKPDKPDKPDEPDEPTAGANLEVYIELADYGFSSSSSGAVNHLQTSAILNPDDYDNATYFFEIVAENMNVSNAYTVTLRYGATDIASISVPANTTAATRLRSSSFTPNSGATTYFCRTAQSGANDDIHVRTARIIIVQTNATKTRVAFPLINLNYWVNAPDQAWIDSTWSGYYNQTAIKVRHYAIWLKDSSKFASLSGATPWTFEAVLSNNKGSDWAYACLFNKTDNTPIPASEVSARVNRGSQVAVAADFADNETNFHDGDEFEFRIKAGADGCSVYRACLYVRLTNLTKAETYIRTGASRVTYGEFWNGNHQRALINMSGYSSPKIYYEAVAMLNENVDVIWLQDHGTADSGTEASSVPGSAINVNSATKVRRRTSGITLTDDHRYYNRCGVSAGSMHFTHGIVIIHITSQASSDSLK